MISLLPTVKLVDLCPQMVLATQIIAFLGDQTVTAGSDGQHMEGSLHYKGRALDYRTHHLFLNLTPDQRAAALTNYKNEIKRRLGPDFDVLVESVNYSNEHLHIEYDPKG